MRTGELVNHPSYNVQKYHSECCLGLHNQVTALLDWVKGMSADG